MDMFLESMSADFIFFPLHVVFKLNCRLHGNVESVAVLSTGAGDGSRSRDSIILTFQDAKISILEFDDSIHGLRTT